MSRLRRTLGSVLSALVLTACVTHAQAADFSAWGKNSTITFPGYAGASTLNNFPVLVKLSTAISGFSYSDLQANGADLRFADAGGNELSYEIDTWNSSGTSYIWVKVPALASGTTITAYWKNPGASAPSYVAGSVWDTNFRAVYHLNDTIANGNPVNDSTANNSDGTQNNVAAYAAGSSGQAVRSDGFKTLALPGAIMTTAAYTKHIWIRRETNSGWGAVFYGAGTNDPSSTSIGMGWPSGTNVYGNNRNNTGLDANDPTDFAAGIWQHVAWVYDAATPQGRLYRNGNLVSVLTNAAAPLMVPSAVYIFGVNAGGDFGATPLSADEVRVSHSARSGDWLMAEYKTQGDNANFTSYGTVQTVVNANNLIVDGDTWLFHNTGALPGASWYATAFSDGTWSSGAAPLGYPVSKPVTTVLSYGGVDTNKWAAYYFRKHFTIANPAAVTGLLASFKVDDGAVIYLNGTRVRTTANIIEPVANNTLTLGAVTEPYVAEVFTINPNMLVTGDNVLAVEVHQSGLGSSDVYLDLSLTKVDYATTNQVGGGYTPPSGWTAYNDFNLQVGELNSRITSYWASNGTNGGGTLVEYSSGMTLSARVDMSLSDPALAAVSQWGLQQQTDGGTDAANIFTNKVSPEGYMNWANQIPLTITLSQLNAAKTYKVALYGNRVSYDGRVMLTTISSVDAFVNQSSAGSVIDTISIANDQTIIPSTNQAGRVALYTDIQPGTDGTITFTVQAGGLYSGILNAMMVEELSAVAPGGDADSDGMDDAWETSNFGSTTATNGGALEDYDSDGSCNYDEYKAGTSPTSGASKLELTGAVVVPAGGGMVLNWSSVAGKTYTILNTTNLVGTWNVHASGVAATAPANVYTTPVSTVREFWRVRLNQ